jgi:hypothetical protein
VEGQRVGEDDEANAAFAALSQEKWKLHDPQVLALLDLEQTQTIFAPAAGAGDLPMLVERTAALVELGKGLLSLGGIDAQCSLAFVLKCADLPLSFEFRAFGLECAHLPLSFEFRAFGLECAHLPLSFEFRAFALLEARPCASPMACLSGVHFLAH